jgi:hypothetical protein
MKADYIDELSRCNHQTVASERLMPWIARIGENHAIRAARKADEKDKEKAGAACGGEKWE